jgi:hypothetical protein
VSALLRLGLREPAREREILIALGGSRERPPGIYPFQARCCCLLMFLIVISAFWVSRRATGRRRSNE